MKRLFGILFLVALTTFASAQNEDYKSTVTAGVGFTLSGALMSAVETASLGEINRTGIPNIEIAYDYGIAKWFSVGVMGAYQKLSLEETITGEVSKYSVSRIYAGTSLLFHYANAGRVDLFSGFRVGFKSWGAESTIADGVTGLDFDDISFFGNGVSFQVLLFGIRGYVTDKIGINVEVLSIGTPHISSLGLSMRF